MKHLKSILLATTLFLAASFTSHAQSKVAHISMQEVAEAMPKWQNAQMELQKLSKAYEVEIQDMVKELENKQKEQGTIFSEKQAELENKAKLYQEQYKTRSQIENEKLAQEISVMENLFQEEVQKVQRDLQEMRQSIGNYEMEAQKEIQKKIQDLTLPIQEEIRAAISKVGKAKGFDYVLDSSVNNNGVIYAGGTDLIQDVKTELGF